jgi:hypothetical protein
MMISLKANFIGSERLDYYKLLFHINIDLKIQIFQLCNLKFKFIYVNLTWLRFNYFQQKRFKYLNITLR